MIGLQDRTPTRSPGFTRLPNALLRRGGLVLALSLAAAAPCRAEEGNIFSNLFKYGGTTVPPSQPETLDPPYCPPVEVVEGAAASRTLAGDTVRTQYALARLARECTRRQDGSITVKVGAEVNVLLGPAGAPGRFDVPVTFQIRYNGKVVSSRAERVSVTVGPGEAQGFATVVADDLQVPAAMTAEYDIAVGVGAGKGAGKAAAKPRRRKPAVAAAPAGGGDAAQ
ncbi:hypothetical protein MCBMB27_02977 [Methylobacterium phyllosphaerae]|uniref:Tat pathway signal sequence domain protein n=1 Tax=Methylobacterium phyllosphaerae TaxID=418223 RepID=A0AAE8HY13_9HYPH|nr:hypothetical protein [Methylobacterium phyllosphaerae]APT32268.1 hypothetical protein MCBMB27_02977 [Methylobacterium phyllosphaerae]SFH69885.1 hypothetical protein SAMN05192567_14626 [Methylobacterium phyllosphaerae]